MAPQLFHLGYNIIHKRVFLTPPAVNGAINQWAEIPLKKSYPISRSRTRVRGSLQLSGFRKPWCLPCGDRHPAACSIFTISNRNAHPASGNTACPERTTASLRQSSCHGVTILHAAHSIHQSGHCIHCAHFTAGLFM